MSFPAAGVGFKSLLPLKPAIFKLDLEKGTVPQPPERSGKPSVQEGKQKVINWGGHQDGIDRIKADFGAFE